MTKITVSNHAVRAGLAALSAIALFSAIPAAAQENLQEKVAYGDLDLTSDAGQSTLNKRVRAAVKRVCGPFGKATGDIHEWSRCKRQSFTGARAQMEVAIARAGVSRTGIAANMAIGAYPNGKH